jgi:hypothetical protein
MKPASRSSSKNAPLDPQATEAMNIAFEKAMAKLGNKSQPSEVIEVIAKRIMELGRQGERDPDRLCEYGINWMLD